MRDAELALQTILFVVVKSFCNVYGYGYCRFVAADEVFLCFTMEVVEKKKEKRNDSIAKRMLCL